MLNDTRIKSCLSRFDSGAYSHLQFLRAVSHSVGAHTESLQPRDDSSSSSSSQDEDSQAPVPAATTSVASESENGSSCISFWRLLRIVPRGATCWLRTGAVRTCAVLWILCYARVSYGWGMSSLSCGYYHGNAYFYTAPQRWPESWQLSLPHV